jgi:hypothetical protein
MMLRAGLRTPVVAAFVVALLALFSSGRAEAQLLGTGGTGLTTGTGGSGGTTFAAADIFVGVQQIPTVNLSDFDVARFFNKAHCDCSTPVYIFVALQASGIAKRATVTGQTGTVSIVLGPGCGSLDTQIIGQQTGNCITVATEPVLTFLNQAQYTVTTNARTISNYLAPVFTVDAGSTISAIGSCTSAIGQFTQTINVLFDFDGDGIIDLNVPDSVIVDLNPPPQPMGVTIQGGDEALIMNWTAIDTSVTTDLLGYQILCSRADHYQVFPETPTDGAANGAFTSGFLTCPLTQVGMGVDGSIEGSDPQFVCSPLLSAESTSYRVKILQNDITYAATVVAVDNSGNASAPVIGYGTPIKTLSFYEVYRNENPQDPGGASGGFCALATARPRLASTLGALLVFGLGALGLVIARRRRGRR